VDNVTIAPWGDLLLCEDGPEENRVVGVTPQGQLYLFARNAMNDSEFAGGTFSPDGSTFFVNIQNPGMTLAITGPWRRGQS
jgi:secreted PhoX family phosphatase